MGRVKLIMKVGYLLCIPINAHLIRICEDGYVSMMATCKVYLLGHFTCNRIEFLLAGTVPNSTIINVHVMLHHSSLCSDDLKFS